MPAMRALGFLLILFFSSADSGQGAARELPEDARSKVATIILETKSKRETKVLKEVSGRLERSNELLKRSVERLEFLGQGYETSPDVREFDRLRENVRNDVLEHYYFSQRLHEKYRALLSQDSIDIFESLAHNWAIFESVSSTNTRRLKGNVRSDLAEERSAFVLRQTRRALEKEEVLYGMQLALQKRNRKMRMIRATLLTVIAFIFALAWGRRKSLARLGASPRVSEIPVPAQAQSRATQSPPPPATGLPKNGEFSPGDSCGSYLIQRFLERDDFGERYLATDTEERDVEVLRLRRELHEDDKDVDRLLERVRPTLELRHPNIAVAEAVFLDGERIHIAQARRAGMNLEEAVSQKKWASVRELKRLGSALGRGLAHAHMAGIAHGDIHRGCIIVGEKIMLADFALGHVGRRIAARRGWSRLLPPPVHTAPEAEVGSPRVVSDIFSVGVILYFAATGRLPYQGPDFLAQKRGKVYSRPSRLSPGLPKDFDTLINGLLDPDPEARCPSAEDFLYEIENFA